MKHLKRHAVNHSVLNTDAFDRRRFSEIVEMSTDLLKLRDEGVLPMFEPLLADIWASLYKMKPEITTEKVDSVLHVNKLLMERIMGDNSFANYRSYTRLDDLASAIGTLKLGEKINQWLAEQIDKDKEFQKRMQEKQQGERNEVQAFDKNSTEVKPDLDFKLLQSLQTNSYSFSQTMVQAMKETKEVKECLKSLLGGCSVGSGEAALKKVPLRDQLALVEKLHADKKMKEIADWAGRFKQIARKKKKSIHKVSMDRSGVTLGNEIERLLAMELGLYTHAITKNDFLRRYVEGQTMQYEQKGNEVLGKGPIVLCLDQSASMYKLDTQSKGFTLALMSIARKQRRDFCLILFSTRIEIHKFEKGKMNGASINSLVQTFLGGGTNFVLPLQQALCTINESTFTQADLVFVTDGEDRLNTSFLETFNKNKKGKDFNVLSLVLGSSTNTVEQFSDRVVKIKDFEDVGSLSAFDI